MVFEIKIKSQVRTKKGHFSNVVKYFMSWIYFINKNFLFLFLSFEILKEGSNLICSFKKISKKLKSCAKGSKKHKRHQNRFLYLQNAFTLFFMIATTFEGQKSVLCHSGLQSYFQKLQKIIHSIKSRIRLLNCGFEIVLRLIRQLFERSF